MSTLTRSAQKDLVADAVWIATALLHAENPDRLDFRTSEIRDRARRDGLAAAEKPGFNVHLSSHSIANKPSQTQGGYRMLFDTGYGRRRLFREGDEWDASRDGKIVPNREELPEKYHWLLDWYRRWGHGQNGNSGSPASATKLPKTGRFDGLLRLRGTWTEIDAAEYIRSMREEWR